MKLLWTSIIALALCLVSLEQTRARPDFDASTPVESEYKIVAIEAANCTYCEFFRRDVLPKYKASERGKSVPVIFVDVNETAAAKLTLSEPIEVVPTFIVTRKGIETGRISGYAGLENFFHSVNYLLSSKH